MLNGDVLDTLAPRTKASQYRLCNSYGINFVEDAIYNGCFGLPFLLTPRQYMGLRFAINSVIFFPCPRKSPCVPHAHSTDSTCCSIASTCAKLSGPTGSAAVNSSSGFVALYAKRLATRMPPCPKDLAKFTQRRIVLSSVVMSAVLGFSMTTPRGVASDQMRRSKYLYVSHFEIVASESKYAILLVYSDFK